MTSRYSQCNAVHVWGRNVGKCGEEMICAGFGGIKSEELRGERGQGMVMT